ncbi:MAG: hypothetical protein ACODAJ_15880 [Planctomycetota bacterium]
MTSKMTPFACLLATAWALRAGEPRPAIPEDPEPHRPQVTKFVAPLRQHQARLETVGEQLDQVAASASTDAAAVERVGKSLLDEGKACHTTFRRFLAGETRRGLDLEVDLVRDNVQTVQDLVLRYRRLAGVEVQPVAEGDRDPLRREVERMVVDELRRRIARRFDSEGVRDVLESRSLREAEARAVENIQRKIDERLDQETERVFGIGFHDRRSARRAVRSRINRAIDTQVGKLLMKITSKELVIMVGTQLIAGWVKDQFWNRIVPRVKEMFRGKGNLEPRVERSAATLRKARLRLMALKPDARIADVERELKNALRTKLAARFLIQDLTRAGRKDLLAKLEADITWLEKGRRFTHKRFLLHKEDLVSRLATDEKVLADALLELAQILKVQPDVATGKLFFFPYYHVPTEDGPQPKPETPGGTQYWTTVFDYLHVIDLDRLNQQRPHWTRYNAPEAYMSLAELVAKSRLRPKEYDKDYVTTFTCAGQTLHRYHAFASRRRTTTGAPYLLGLSPGVHTAEVHVTTEEGLELDLTVQFRIQPKKPVTAERVGQTKQRVEESRAWFAKLAGDERARHTAKHLRLIQQWLLREIRDSGGTGQDLMPYLREINERAELLLEGKQGTSAPDSYIFYKTVLAGWCEQINTAEALALARGALVQAQTRANAAGVRPGRKTLIATAARRCANMAIGIDNDIPAARTYLTHWLAWQKAAGRDLDAEKEKRWWPKEWK